jgi:hypothetical protein
MSPIVAHLQSQGNNNHLPKRQAERKQTHQAQQRRPNATAKPTPAQELGKAARQAGKQPSQKSRAAEMQGREERLGTG